MAMLRSASRPAAAANARPVRHASRSAGGSVVLMAAVGAAVAALAAGIAAFGVNAAGAGGHARDAATATTLSRAVAARFAGDRAVLEAFAARAELSSALDAGNRDRLAELAGLFRAAYPRALRLLVVPRSGLSPAPDATPPIGYALVEQVEAALGGNGSSIELHFAGGPQSHINLVAPIGQGASPRGALVLSYPEAVLTDLLQPAAAGAGVVLEQRLGSETSRVLRLGRATTAAASAEIAGTPWRLRYAPPPGAGILAGPGLVVMAAVAAGAAALMLVLGLVAARRLRQTLVEAGECFVELVQDLTRGRLEATYTSPVHELAPAMQRCTAAAHDHGPESAGAARTAAEEPPVADGEVDSDEPAPIVTETSPESAVEPLPATADTPLSEHPMTVIDPSILRAYDIRGIVGTTLTPEVMTALGLAIGSEAADRGEPSVVVGYDGRASSPELAEALINGLSAAGRAVIDIGRVTTPMVYFAAHHLETHCGVAVTGSHNPPEYNGLKVVVGGDTLWGEAIQGLGRRIAEGNLTTGQGWVERRDIRDDYLERVANDVTLHRPLKIVADAGNGIAGEIAPLLYERIGAEVEALYCEVDGNFPNHHPDPSVPENLTALIDRVVEQGADLGLAFDGDGDRLGVVDNRGQIIWADRQMMLYAGDLLSRQPGSDIIFDVKCTSHLAQVITAHAGVPLMWKTGHSLIKEKLKETGAPLAGEMSGHIFFNDRWYGFDDGVYAGARLLEILSIDPRAADEIFAELPTGVSTPEIRVDLSEGEPPALIEALLAETEQLEGARVTTIDGLRVDFPDGWGLVRASNTQPCLVLRFEGDDQPALERIRELFRERLERARPGIELPF